jgi:hypothetical protein
MTNRQDAVLRSKAECGRIEGSMTKSKAECGRIEGSMTKSKAECGRIEGSMTKQQLGARRGPRLEEPNAAEPNSQ